MINVSQKYIAAANAPSRETELRGQILLKTGEVVPFTSRDLLSGSTTYSNSCLANGTFNLGSCYIGEFRTTIRTTLDRYTLPGGVIVVEFLLKVDTGEWESVNVGTFNIATSKRVGNYIELDCFDNMSLLERAITAGTNGTAKDLLNWICQQCGTNSGMTDSMWEELVNTEYTFSFSDGDFSTYRDLLSDLSTLLGGFATVDEFGGIVIKPFGKTSVDTITDRTRESSKFEDYFCKYTSISVSVKGAHYGYEPEINDGLTLQLNNNTLAGANSPDQISDMVENIAAAISEVYYVPAEVGVPVNPAYELGDIISYTGYNTSETTINSPVHSISWAYRATMTLKGIGDNSKIANAQTATDKIVAGVDGSASRVELKTLQFTNAKEILFDSINRETILDTSFSATYDDNAVPLLSGQFSANITSPGLFRIIYSLNDEEILFTPQEEVKATGWKTFTFIKALPKLSTETSNRLKVFIECGTTTIMEPVLVQGEDGKYTLEMQPKEYSGSGTIEVGDVQAVIQSANLSFAIKWDGNFEIIEEVKEPIQLNVYKIEGSSSSNSISIITSDKLSFSEEWEGNAKDLSAVQSSGNSEIIFDYDALKIYDLPFTEIGNGATDTANFEEKSVVFIPGTETAGLCAPYYMDIPAGDSTKITLTTDQNATLYLLDVLTADAEDIAITAPDGIINYTSTGARFWILAITSGRDQKGTYTITTEKT